MKKLTKILIFLLLLIMATGSLGCAQKDTSAKDLPPLLKITDFVGREVSLVKAPTRIVSLSPATTELLFALGVGEKVVGVTDYDDYPQEVKNLPKVGGFRGPNMEAIAEQKPELIFASSISGKEQMELLQKMGIPVIVLEAKSIQQIYEAIAIISKIMDVEEKGQALAEELKGKFAAITAKVKDLPKVDTFYLVDTNGTWTAGKDTFIDELITLAGGNNVVSEFSGWGQYSLEKLLEKDPAVIITAPHAGDVKNLHNLAGFKETTAVKKGRVYIISDDNLISRASHRMVLGLEEIARELHPEAFK